MASHTTQDMKAAITSRVDTGEAFRLYGTSRILGHPAMCPANAQNINHDIYSRPITAGMPWTGVLVNDAACSQATYPASRRIAHENSERPYIPVAPAGLRNAGDFMLGNARNWMPKGLYPDTPGEGRGGWQRFYITGNDAPPHVRQPNMSVPYNFGVSTLSHDAVVDRRCG